MAISKQKSMVRYSDEDLAEFKALIEDKLAKGEEELASRLAQLTELSENAHGQQSGDWTDESTNHAEMELLNNIVVRQQTFVQNLRNALLRIQNKTYGICTITGQLIDKKRLLLVPHATKSVEGKMNRPAPIIASPTSARNPNAAAHTDEWREADTSEKDTIPREFFGE